jgi:hypothetical protein
MKDLQQLSFFVSKRKQIPTLLFISLFWMEYHLLDISKPQLFQAKIFIERAKTKTGQNLAGQKTYSTLMNVYSSTSLLMFPRIPSSYTLRS